MSSAPRWNVHEHPLTEFVEVNSDEPTEAVSVHRPIEILRRTVLTKIPKTGD